MKNDPMRCSRSHYEGFDRGLRFVFFITAGLIFLRPSWLKFSTPLGRMSLTSAQNIAILFCFLWGIAVIVNRRRYLTPSGLEFPLFLFLAANVVAALLSPFGSPAERWCSVLEIVLYISFFYASLYLLRSRDDCGAVLAILFLAAVIAALGDLSYHWEKGLRKIVDQSYPFWDGKNALGLFMALSIALCIPELASRSASRGCKALVAAGLFAFFLCGVYSYSRAAWLAMAGVAAAFALMRSWKIVVLLALALLVLIPLPHTRIMRRITYTGGVYDVNASLRLDAWKSAVAMLRDYPFAGVGPGQFRTVARVYAGFPPGGKLTRTQKSRLRHLDHAHNLFLHVGAEAGWPGMAVLIWGCVAVARVALRTLRTVPDERRRGVARGIIAALTGFFVFSLVDCSWTGRFTGGSFLHINLIVMMILAMLCALETRPVPALTDTHKTG
ncbi:MAG: O-antigen ligase family protein [Candidatus Aureabacteria bacterium]|nr:O-antigen ligase family protein [Candidatus Auribacterota bacterium]